MIWKPKPSTWDGPWRWWFAVLPCSLEDGRVAWLRLVQRQRCCYQNQHYARYRLPPPPG